MSANISDPRVFLTLPREQRQRLLREQAKELEQFYQPGSPHMEWTEAYEEDTREPFTQTR
jgi:hypothetical protein